MVKFYHQYQFMHKITIVIYFFPRGYRNKFSNLIDPLRNPDVPISTHGQDNACASFFIKVQKLFQNSFL